MRSFNALTPHYEEGVVYSLRAFDTARMLGLEQQKSALVCSCCGLRTPLPRDILLLLSPLILALQDPCSQSVPDVAMLRRNCCDIMQGTTCVQKLADLTTKSEDGVSTMNYMRSLYCSDWNNMLVRRSRR